MSDNPLKARMRASLQKGAQSTQPEPVSAIEAPLRNRFRRAEELDGQPPHLTLAPPASTPISLPDDTEWSEEYRRWCLSNNYQPGATFEVGLAQVKESPFNPRHFYPSKSLETLTSSIAEQKQQQPIHVVPDYDNPGEFFLHDGGRRIRSMRILKYSKALAIAVDVPVGIQSYKLGYELNSRRASQTVFDNAVKWNYLLENRHFSSQKELAEALGIDESTVSQTLTIGKLPVEILAEMHSSQENFPIRVAYEVAKFHQDNEGNVEKTLDLIERVLRLDMKVRQVIEFRSRFNAARRGEARVPRKARSPAPSTPALLSGEKESEGSLLDPMAVPSRPVEEYQSANGNIRATLTQGEAGLVLKVQGSAEEDLTAIADALRQLLLKAVH